jgi:UDP-N-acetylenolpyruvoylglucosamine reductase
VIGKGNAFNDVGVHANQALVLVNYGNGSGEEIFQLAKKISASVKVQLSTLINSARLTSSKINYMQL